MSVDRDSNRDRYFLDNNRNSDRDRHFLGNLKDKNRNSDSTDRDRDIHYLGINRLGETNKDRNSFGMDRDRDYFIRDRNSLDRDRLERLPMFDRNSYDDKQSYSNLHFNTRYTILIYIHMSYIKVSQIFFCKILNTPHFSKSYRP